MKYTKLFKKPAFYNIFLLISLLFLIYSIYDFNQYNRIRKQEYLNTGFSKLYEIRDTLNTGLNTIQKVAYDLSDKISNNYHSKNKIEEIIKKATLENNFAMGIVAAFEPVNGKLFAPYYSKHIDKIDYIEDSYDYTIDSLKTTKWYNSVIKQKKAVWSDPYVSDIIHELVVDFGVPIYKRKPKGDKEIIGVLSITIPSSFINNYIHKISLGKTGFSIIANTHYFFISHPSTNYLTRSEITQSKYKTKSNFKKIIESQPKDGHLTEFSAIAQQDAEFFYTSLNQGWLLISVFTENDLIQKSDESFQKIITISIFISLTLVLLLMRILQIWKGNNRELWIFSFLISFIIFLNIVFIWHQKINSSYISETSEIKILSPTTIDNYVKERNKKLKQIDASLQSIEIPTGIFIYDIEFLSAYNVAVSGKIWQKIPDSLEINNDVNFVFPQAAPEGISVRTRPKLKKHIKGYWLYRTDFNASLRFDINYINYPLNIKKLNLQLKYPNIDRNVILTPDLNSYDFIQPSLKPGISKDLYMPSSKVLETYFSFTEHNFYSNLGNEEFTGLKENPILTFNILIKNILLNSIITNIVPIFIIALMVFLLPFTVDRLDGKAVPGAPLNLIQAASGFFFVILLNHIQLRDNIQTPGFTYIESYYFIMYIMLTIMSAAVLIYLKTDKYKILEYKKNLIFKISYWPILLMLVYLITLSMFYW